jgi:membrane protease YdiL (CAAX protease family)
MLSNQFFSPNISSLWSTLFASLPMLWLIQRYLLKPRGQTLVSAFGLSLRGIKIKQALYITISLLALELIGLLLIGWGTWKMGLASHWAHGIQERLVFGPTQTVIFSVINIVIWAPIFEEIGFRGLLYTTFRQRLSPTLAIVLSALIFSALHLKSLNGFISIFWSGLILAYAFEKYRSLLPGILIHSLGNLLYLSTVLLFYR